MFEIDVRREFSAAHAIAGYPGNCSRLHGHNWEVVATVCTPRLDDLGIACDFRRLRQELEAVIAEFDHRDLATLPCFKGQNPTSERLAQLIFERLAARINAGELKVVRVRVSESPGSGATYYENA
jgi:6-pyruvoyltetrahydropterin/6-carboxytetrahydropterin synthase